MLWISNFCIQEEDIDIVLWCEIHADKGRFRTDFFIYNNYKNHIINNKSDKTKILNL
jgi:hypothetical protein